jgi:imidazolonepropionase-like amidohydrolase
VAREFDLRLVLDGGAEAYQLIDEIKAAGVPVIVHPPMARAAGELENATMELAGRLRAAGIPIALQSGYEDYVPKTRVVLYEAAVADAHGLGPEAALSALTIDAARLLGRRRSAASSRARTATWPLRRRPLSTPATASVWSSTARS